MKKLVLFLAILCGMIGSSNVCMESDVVLSNIKAIRVEEFVSGAQDEKVKIGRNSFLQIFYEKKSENNYASCAFLIKEEESDKRIARFSNFPDYYDSVKAIAKGGMSKKLLVITDDSGTEFRAGQIEDTHQPEELLGMRASFVRAESDTVIFGFVDTPEKIELYNPMNVEQIRMALSGGLPLVVNLVENGTSHAPFKVLVGFNNTYIQWNGWMPKFVSCVGMTLGLIGIGAPVKAMINLDQEKEYLPTYKRNKHVSKFLILSICAGFAYWLKIKISL